MKYETLRTVPLHSLTISSYFKIGLVCNLGIWGVFGVLVGISAFMGADTVTFGEENIYGFSAFITALLISVLFSVFGAVFLFLGGCMARLLGKFMSFGTISFHDDGLDEEQNQAAE